MMKKTLAAAVLMLAAAQSGFALEVYNWKSANGVTVYSDAPKNLRIKNTKVMNVRTHTSHAQTNAMPPMPESLADQQAMLSQKIAAQNRQIEQQNAKIAADMQKAKEENCRTAQSSRKLAEGARNRDQLVQKYDADIERYCN